MNQKPDYEVCFHPLVYFAALRAQQKRKTIFLSDFIKWLPYFFLFLPAAGTNVLLSNVDRSVVRS